jgi:hypothetical protein
MPAGTIFYLLHSVQTGSRSHPAAYPVSTVCDFPGIKRPVHEANHSLPSSSAVKNGGAIPLLPHMSSWHSALLIRENCTYVLLPVTNRVPHMPGQAC